MIPLWWHADTQQHTATHGNKLQNSAAHRNTQQFPCAGFCMMFASCVKLNPRGRASRHTATHCKTPQHTATTCNILQHAAARCNTLQHTARHCNTLQLTATLCNTLQHIDTHCSTLQHTATHRNTPQHTATHCSAKSSPNGASRAGSFNVQLAPKSPFRMHIDIYI